MKISLLNLSLTLLLSSLLAFGQDAENGDNASVKGLEQFSNKVRLSTVSYDAEMDGLIEFDRSSDSARQIVDALGNIHMKYRQSVNGMRVFGGDIVESYVEGRFSVNGRVGMVDGLNPVAAVSSEQAKASVWAFLPRAELEPELIVYPTGNGPRLVWLIKEIAFDSAWQTFVDAHSGQVINAFNNIQHGTGVGVLGDTKEVESVQVGSTWNMNFTEGGTNRRTYSANNGTSLPGTLSADSNNNWNAGGQAAAVDAHFYAGQTLDFYREQFNRNSFDGNGAQLRSTVNFRTNYVNAFWNGSQMVYGDGDGTTSLALSGGLDVVAHEITHAVTTNTSNLIYQNESGALNEAFSDIMAAAVEFHKQPTQFDWLVGEDIWTPATAGDALRYMNNPTQDGSSRDHYSTRYTGTQDNGGVHWNSGIANLAFYLVVDGGSHPSQAGPTVSGIGMVDAEQIFYTGFTTLSSSATFADARASCISAASSYSAAIQQAVSDAWAAVGVGSSGPPAGTVELSNGQTVSGLSAGTGNWLHYKVVLPSGATNLVATMSGGTGDADLYTRDAAEPTTASYDCRPYASGNSESCNAASPSAGDYFISIRAFSTFSGVSLTVSWTGPVSNQAPTAGFSSSVSDLTVNFTDSSSDPDGTIASRSWNFGDGNSSSSTNPTYTYASAGTYTVTLTVTDDDGATDSASASVTVTAPPTGGSDLSNGQTVTGLSGSTGAWDYYTLTVPSGATNLNISISGGTGDADLYVRLGAQPTTSSYDCRPYKNGNNETCTFASPGAGVFNIGLRAFSSYSGVSLTVSFTEPGGGTGGGGTVENISGSTGAWNHYTLEVPAGQSSMEVSIAGGSGDADLYIRFGAQPTTSSYDYRPYLSGNNESVTVANPQAGTWHISIRAYSTFSGVTLSAFYFP